MRVKKKILSNITTQQADSALSSFAKASAQEQILSSEMEKRIADIHNQYDPELSSIRKTKEEAFDILQTYATENKRSLFNRKKSLVTPYGSYGFRRGTPQLKIQDGITWSIVTSRLKEQLPQYIRTIEEPAKDILLLARNDQQISTLFPEIGIYVSQDESFFIDCKKQQYS